MHTRHTQRHTPEAQTLFFSFRVRDGHSSTRAPARVASPPPVTPCVFDRRIVRVARETEHRAKLSLPVRSRDWATLSCLVLADVSRAGSLYSLSLSVSQSLYFSLSRLLSLSMCTSTTITLSHRRPEQKGKSMKEKYDASARKSAFMLACCGRRVPRFHFDRHIRTRLSVYRVYASR